MNKADLEIVIEKSYSIFKQIKEKYKGLSGYLVFAAQPGRSPYGQCEITNDLIRILKVEKNDKGELSGFPGMIHDSKDKTKAIELIKQLSKLDKSKKDSYSEEAKQKVDKEIKSVTENLLYHLGKIEIKEDTLVEIRFKQLEYDLIFKLQKDPLVSQEHTPQSRSSIKIVLGTIGEVFQKT